MSDQNDPPTDDHDVRRVVELAAGPRTSLSDQALQAVRSRYRRRRTASAVAGTLAIMIGIAGVVALLPDRAERRVTSPPADTQSPSSEPACYNPANNNEAGERTSEAVRSTIVEWLLDERTRGSELDTRCVDESVLGELETHPESSRCVDLSNCEGLVEAEFIEGGGVLLTFDDGVVVEEIYDAHWQEVDEVGPIPRLTGVRIARSHVRWTDPPDTPEDIVIQYLDALAAGDWSTALLYMESTAREAPTGHDPTDPQPLRDLAQEHPDAGPEEILRRFCDRFDTCRSVESIEAVEETPDGQVAVTVNLAGGPGGDSPTSAQLTVGQFEGIFTVSLPMPAENADADGSTTGSTDASSPPGKWRPPQPQLGETLLRFDPRDLPEGDLPDGEHFGILDRVAETAEGPVVRFSLGDRVTGDEAAKARADARAAAGVGTEPGDEIAIAHDWWTPQHGEGVYIYPDFDLPVTLPVNLDALSLIVTPHDGPVDVSWQQFLDHADGRGDLPYHWSGLVFVTITDGQITHILSPYSP